MAATYQRVSGRRLLLNVVTGGESIEQRAYGDFLDKDDRYVRTGEFLKVVRALWRGERLPRTGVPDLEPMFPPVHRVPLWVAGRAANERFYRRMFGNLLPGQYRHLSIGANGAPALAFYRPASPGAPHTLTAIQLVTTRDGAIVAIDHFGASAEGSVLFEQFGFTPDRVVAAARASLERAGQIRGATTGT